MAVDSPFAKMPRRSGLRRWAGGLAAIVALTTACDASTPAGFGGGSAVGTTFTIAGAGFGHGVGMSQYGARGRADAGQSVQQILDAAAAEWDAITEKIGVDKQKAVYADWASKSGAYPKM